MSFILSTIKNLAASTVPEEEGDQIKGDEGKSLFN